MLSSGGEAETSDNLLHWATVRLRLRIGTCLHLSTVRMTLAWYLSAPIYYEDDTSLVPVCTYLPTYTEAWYLFVSIYLPTQWLIMHGRNHTTQTNQNVPNQTLVYVRQRYSYTQWSITPVSAWVNTAIAAHTLDACDWSFLYLPLDHLDTAYGTV
jgi:hypothetical protein